MPDKPAFSLSDFIPYLLNRAAEDTSADFAKIYKNRFGLLRTEWRVLFHLGQIGETTATEIGQRSKIHKTKISRAVAGLEKRRLLKRTRSDTDRRREYIRLMPAGKKMFAELSQAADKYNETLMEKLTLDEQALLKRMLSGFIA